MSISTSGEIKLNDKVIYENGVHDISNADYHASSGISRSGLLDFKRSPFHYMHNYLNEERIVECTPAMTLGALIHTMVLEPHKLDSEFLIAPAMDRRSKEGKLAYERFKIDLGLKTAITQDQYDEANRIRMAVMNHELAPSLLNGCQIEKSIYFTHEASGIQCKVRPDAWNKSLVVDLKSTADASFRAFQRSALNYGYFLQAAMIQQGLKAIGETMSKFTIIAVEKKAPYAIATYIIDKEALEWGNRQFDELMASFAKCLEKKVWPDYGLQVLTLPGYASFEQPLEVDYE